ncbi:hypothetical protein MASR2M66_21650 [Chloroflexota bacterium]
MEQMPSNTPILESKPGPAGWIQVWIKAVTKPSEQTFIEISESPDAKIQTALIWAAIAGFIGGIAAGIISALQLLFQNGGNSNGMGIIVGLICGFPIIFAIITPIHFALSAALYQWIAKLFGGVGSFEKLVYSLAAIAVPISIVSGVISVLSSIPVVGACISMLSFIISIYAVVLNIMAVKAVNRFGWGQAAGSVLIPGLVVFAFFVCILIGGVLVMGPSILDGIS